MSVSTTAHPEPRARTNAKLWLAFLLLIAAGVGLAWLGASPLRPEVTDSGLAFRTVQEGSGEPIRDSDAALLEYVLTADDGTVLDSSQGQGGAQPFTTGTVFPGFAEAMRRMREGGQYRFTMPQRLAFPDGQRPPGFPEDTSLTFDVGVTRIIRDGALMMQMQGMSQPPPQQPPQP